MAHVYRDNDPATDEAEQSGSIIEDAGGGRQMCDDGQHLALQG